MLQFVNTYNQKGCVVPMPSMEESLRRILTEHWTMEIPNNLPFIQVGHGLFGEWEDEIRNVYMSLGGIANAYTFRGRFDFIFPQCIIELDEQLHFNDYRLTTLQSPVYEQLNFFPLTEYRGYCFDYLEECLRAGAFGGMWTSASSEIMFGLAAPPGNLGGSGSPRWKQRAFYDFVKDVSPLVTGIPVVRLSIYDIISNDGGEVMLKVVLGNRNLQTAGNVEDIITLINNRLGII